MTLPARAPHRRYDHEFGGITGDNEVKIMEYAWNWAALQVCVGGGGREAR